ncbi:ABC transporter permease [Paenibacillus baekrokdamisoli]|uniref:ABC transporter permease n=1 Tax=Paenibacillus baekrokdamisoli TaxID=1712516 RepID=A0A3G9JBD7_9BACL|nr:sugar ABC transporter permease [Paenibacillus baekrokdamisoli]MBB3072017.1 ABC-type sugar transport system permease subunit [Paenibacillus baekrokdamisoli]BBH20319.1 ABC transporter permease [Paenibacillus baekrokdamisoli]
MSEHSSSLNNQEPLQALHVKDHARFNRRRRLKESVEGYFFLLPWLIGALIFVAYPLIYSLYMSFTKVSVATDGSGLQFDFLGWKNYVYAFISDNEFPVQMFLFARETVLTIPITVIFALLVSTLLNQKFGGRMMFRTLFFLPVIFATGQVLTALFSQGQGKLPFADQYNLSDVLYNVLPVSIAEVLVGLLGKFIIILWSSGIQIVLFLAAFQTISPSVYEAARIDGVTPWESFWKITFPSIVPFIFLNLIYTVVDQTTSPFNPILKLISKNMGDPNTGFGYSSALGWMYCVLIFIPIIILGIAAKLLEKGRR